MTRGHYIRGKVRLNNLNIWHLKRSFVWTLVGLQLAPLLFKFFAFLVFTPLCSLKFTFSSYCVQETKQGMFSLHIWWTTRETLNVCLEIHHHIYSHQYVFILSGFFAWQSGLKGNWLYYCGSLHWLPQRSWFVSFLNVLENAHSNIMLL